MTRLETPLEKRLIEAGNTLARSLGHKPGCPKLSPAVPCSCAAVRQQAEAMDDWQHLIRDLLTDPQDA